MTLPNFLILGPTKSGSTSLYEYLRQHPDVFMAADKEPMYFSTNWRRGRDWYESLFEGWSGQKAIGEASTWYLHHPRVASRVKETIPGARLVFVFRDPVERLWSDYRYCLVRGAIPTRWSYRTYVEKTPAAVCRGHYREHLRHWETHFPAPQRHIILSEDLASQPAETVAGIFRFLGVDDGFVPDLSHRHNVTTAPRNVGAYVGVNRFWWSVFERLRGTPFEVVATAPRRLLRPIARRLLMRSTPETMSAEDRAWTKSLYDEHNRLLSEHIGRDLSHWT